MSALYPSLEDMKMGHMAQAQQAQDQHQQQQAAAITGAQGAVPQQYPQYPTAAGPASGSSLYPSLGDFMGLQISEDLIKQHLPETHDMVRYAPHSGVVAPITGEQNMGVMRSEVKQGVRQVIGCKDENGRVGIRVQAVNKGVFVSLVQNGSPAAQAGLRFGDQILQINGTTIAGFDMSKVKKMLKDASPQRIEFAIRDRPFERTITLQKDSADHAGFIFKNGVINSIVKDSSAARNGLLIEHNILEVNGQNVVGLKDKNISEILAAADRSITLTIMPAFIYQHMVKSMASSLLKKEMDHSIPDL